jgi:hypothetical protein
VAFWEDECEFRFAERLLESECVASVKALSPRCSYSECPTQKFVAFREIVAGCCEEDINTG